MSNTNIEFIAAKDLPITEAEEVNVLCVENGELKLKNASNLGGGNKEETPEWDAIITSSQDENAETINTLTLGSFETLKTIILNHRIPKVLITGEADGMFAMMTCHGIAFSENDNIIVLMVANMSYIILPDNTIMVQ